MTTDFVKRQQKLELRAKRRGRWHYRMKYRTTPQNKKFGIPYDPFNKVKRAWDEWEARRKERNQKRREQLAVSRGKA